MKKPSYSTVATWVKESWDEIDDDLIQRSFKCCGISTKTDGSEDHYIFDYDQLSSPVNDNDDEIIEVEDDNEIYVEENDYKNEWDVKINNNNNNNNGRDEENQESSCSDDEEVLNELRKKFKDNQCD
jgi:hypothetical protein